MTFPGGRFPEVTMFPRTIRSVLWQHVNGLTKVPSPRGVSKHFLSPGPLISWSPSLHSARLLHLTASAGRGKARAFREPLHPWEFLSKLKTRVWRGISLEGSTALCSCQLLLLNGFDLATIALMAYSLRHT